MDIKEIERIIKILKDNGVSEFELEHDGTKLKLSREMLTKVVSSPAVSHAPVPSVQVEEAATAPASTESGDAIPAHWVKVESPIVGTFYAKPSPDSPVFVQVGDMVSEGDTLCIVEAMKLMNEIEATTAGRIEKCRLSDGQVVEFGEVLFYINPNP